MKKKLIMYVYGDITTDARVQRAAKALVQNYDVVVLSTDVGKRVDNLGFKNVLIKSKNISAFYYYLSTVWKTFMYIKKEKPDIFYGHDYYSALLIRLLCKKKYCKKTIYDAHELIISQDGLSMRSRFFYNLEKKIVNRTDLLICASEERAKIMQDHYHLKSLPLTIKNISQLDKDAKDDETNRQLQSLEDFFSKPGITVVYAGVVMASRKIDELVNAVCKRPEKYKLLIVGKGDFLTKVKNKAASTPNLICAFTGAIPYKSLGPILAKCDIGFIYYPIDTLNNKYCASNKVYEYASVQLPIISNQNPTIQKLLDQWHIGVATNDIFKGLEQVSQQLSFYKHNSYEFTQENQWSDEASSLVFHINSLDLVSR